MEHDRGHSQTPALQFDELVERCMGNLEFAERVLGRFQQRFGEDLGALEAGVTGQRAEEVARLAHRMKGAAANVAAPGLRVQATAVEELARAGQVGEIPAYVEQLKVEWSRFQQSVSVAADPPTTGP
jgi:HPt (histidine-containing phosphotransfer) domain-containing protein